MGLRYWSEKQPGQAVGWPVVSAALVCQVSSIDSLCLRNDGWDKLPDTVSVFGKEDFDYDAVVRICRREEMEGYGGSLC